MMKELWLDYRSMSVPAADEVAFSLASGMSLGLYSTRSTNHKMFTAERPWCGALGEFWLQLPPLDISHRDCSCVDVFLEYLVLVPSIFQNPFKMHSFSLWIFAQKFKIYYRMLSELKKPPSYPGRGHFYTYNRNIHDKHGVCIGCWRIHCRIVTITLFCFHFLSSVSLEGDLSSSLPCICSLLSRISLIS